MENATRNLIEQYWRSASMRDWDAFGQLLHEDVVYEIPQTRERIRGRSAYVEFNATYPGNWSLGLECLVADDERAVSKIVANIDAEIATGISFFELRDGRIFRITDYWPEDYLPPVRVTRHVEKY